MHAVVSNLYSCIQTVPNYVGGLSNPISTEILCMILILGGENDMKIKILIIFT